MRTKGLNTKVSNSPQTSTRRKVPDNEQLNAPESSLVGSNQHRRPKKTLASQIKAFFDPGRAKRKQPRVGPVTTADDHVTTPFNVTHNGKNIVRSSDIPPVHRSTPTLRAVAHKATKGVTWGADTFRDAPTSVKQSGEAPKIPAQPARKSMKKNSAKSSGKHAKSAPKPSHPPTLSARNASGNGKVPASSNGTSPQIGGIERDPEASALIALVDSESDAAAERLIFGGKATAPAPFTPAKPVFIGSEKNLGDVNYRVPMSRSNFGSGIVDLVYKTLSARTTGPAVHEGKLQSVEYRIKGEGKYSSTPVELGELKREIGSVRALRFSEKSSTNFALSIVNHLNTNLDSPLNQISKDRLTISWTFDKDLTGALAAMYRISAADCGVVIEGDIDFSEMKTMSYPMLQAPYGMWKAGRAQAASQLPGAMVVSDVTQPKHAYTRTAHWGAGVEKQIATFVGSLEEEDLTSLAAQGRSHRITPTPFKGVPIVAHEEPFAIEVKDALSQFEAGEAIQRKISG